jgi:hypothetical protein
MARDKFGGSSMNSFGKSACLALALASVIALVAGADAAANRFLELKT